MTLRKRNGKRETVAVRKGDPRHLAVFKKHMVPRGGRHLAKTKVAGIETALLKYHLGEKDIAKVAMFENALKVFVIKCCVLKVRAFDCLVFGHMFLTPDSEKSINVRDEINFAINDNKPFLGIHLKKTDLTGGLKLRVGTKQAILKYNMSEEEFLYKYTFAFEHLGLPVPDAIKGARRPGA